MNMLYSSMCRISDLPDRHFEIEPITKNDWETGDYVVGTVSKRPHYKARVEAPNGREVEPLEGEQIVGALGNRAATREAVGNWKDIDESTGKMDLLCGGGIMGQATSLSPFLHPLITMTYDGHVHVNHEKTRMQDYAPDQSDTPVDDPDIPIILALGTSMSSGKTMSCRVIIRALIELGLAPAACKLTGAGRFHDILTMRDAGAEPIFDFVDAGLPSTVVPEAQFTESIQPIISRLLSFEPDVIVAEIGASPLEPYNGEAAISLLRDNVEFSVLTASDPYAVVGMQSRFDIDIDLVAGIATNTEAGVHLIKQLTDLPSLNLQLEESMPPLITMLEAALPNI